jgi:hypothetical protein
MARGAGRIRSGNPVNGHSSSSAGRFAPMSDPARKCKLTADEISSFVNLKTAKAIGPDDSAAVAFAGGQSYRMNNDRHFRFFGRVWI